MEQRTIKDLVEDLADNAENGRTAAMLIGAGCSKTAGIPLAAEFVAEIKRTHGKDFKRAKQQTYAHCMGALCPQDRHDLISKYIDDAKVNQAHIAIAQLMKGGFVDRVLTIIFG